MYEPRRTPAHSRAPAPRGRPPERPGPQSWTEADFTIPPEVLRDLERTLPDGTRRKYDMWMGRAAGWCQANGRTAFPMTTETMTTWVQWLTTLVSGRTGEPYAASYLRQGVSAIVSYHQIAGQSPPATRQAFALINAHARRLERPVRRSAIITPAQLLDVVRLPACDPSTAAGARNRVMALLFFSLWGRRSELARAQLGHFGTDGRQLTWHVPSSKTDQAGKGHDVHLERTGDELCPVAAWEAWRGVLASRGIVDGRALRSVDRWGTIGTSLSGSRMNETIKELTREAGCYVDGFGRTITSHGFGRASGYSAAKRAGAPAEALRRHGRWSPTSGVPDRVYDRVQDPLKDNPMAAVWAKHQDDQDPVLAAVIAAHRAKEQQ